MLLSAVLSNTRVGTSYASQLGSTPSSAQVPSPLLSMCNPNSPTLQLGFTGAKVAELQRILVQLGYGSLLGQSGIDGKFGQSTLNAVKNFQEDTEVTPFDGIVGPRTWVVLCDAIASATGPVQQQHLYSSNHKGKRHP